MKKIIAFFLTVLLCISLCACAEPVTREPSKGIENFAGFFAIPGKNGLYYDGDTKIVYIIFKECAGYDGYGFMSPYYAPNGLPYLYDASNRVLTEIAS